MTSNVSLLLRDHARATPGRVALHSPDGRDAKGVVRYASMTYAELERDVAALALSWSIIGIARGDRVAVMVKPGPAFFAILFSLFRAGAVPVLIDPGIDRRALRQCLAEAEPSAFIGIPLAHVARIVLGWARDSVRTLVTVGTRWAWGGHRYDELLRRGRAAAAQADPSELEVDTRPDELAAILFTSGSTGIPKGVEYQHRHFVAQVDMIRRALGIEPGEIDLPTFAPFALFDPALGVTTVLPPMDFANPGRVDPNVLVDAVQRFGVTMMFGSPAVMGVLARHHAATGRIFGSVRRMLSAGAPVRPDIVAQVRAMLPDDASFYTPYGATECLPVAIVEGRDIAAIAARATPDGAGILVGHPLPENRVRIVEISDAPVASFDALREVPTGAIGEIVVEGPTVTERYFRRDAQTNAAKIVGDDGRIAHRMGDLGWLDADGRLWYVGRKSHRVETANGPLYPEQVEGVLNTHAAVARTALVGVDPARRRAATPADKDATPVVCVELKPGVPATEWPRIARELAQRARSHHATAGVTRFLRHDAFPVDIRHNAKINRERLATWAAAHFGDVQP